jgi:hypothetical protein
MRVNGRMLVIAVIALALATAITVTALLPGGSEEGFSSRPIRPLWAERHWPFPVDPWGKGKAFHCKAVDCGGEVHVYVRAKLGFCNCTTGIADDEDLDRMGDLDLIGGRVMPIGPGRQITVGSLQGRSRVYSRGGRTVIAMAFNERCDMVAATTLLAHKASPAMESAVLDFLNSETMMKWTEVTLGL